MGLHINDAEIEQLAREVAELASESEADAVRRALLDRKEQLLSRKSKGGKRRTVKEMMELLERDVWSKLPPDVLGKHITKEEREDILGYGPHGY